jgi:glutathione S-transferase
MKIYWFGAQAPQRVMALVKHLDVKAELIEIDVMARGLKAPEYLALNPNAKAPTLVDGDLVLWEASAIMAYLCIKAGSDMWPANNPGEQVEVLRWLSWSDCHWSPVVSVGYVEHIIKAKFNMGPPDDKVMDAGRAGLARLAKILDDWLSDKDFVACGRLTIADFQLASMASYWRQADMRFETFPNLVRWLDHLAAIPAWADPWPTKAKAD